MPECNFLLEVYELFLGYEHKGFKGWECCGNGFLDTISDMQITLRADMVSSNPCRMPQLHAWPVTIAACVCLNLRPRGGGES